jgi:hypothetical protein
LRSKVSPTTAATLACWKGSCLAGEAVGRLWRLPAGRHRAGQKVTGRGALGANLAVPPLLLAWVGAEDTGIDQGTVQQHGSSAWASSNSAAPVILISFDLLLPVLDEMPARTQNLNFQNFPLWVLIILDKVPSHIFVTGKG